MEAAPGDGSSREDEAELSPRSAIADQRDNNPRPSSRDRTLSSARFGRSKPEISRGGGGGRRGAEPAEKSVHRKITVKVGMLEWEAETPTGRSCPSSRRLAVRDQEWREGEGGYSDVAHVGSLVLTWRYIIGWSI